MSINNLYGDLSKPKLRPSILQSSIKKKNSDKENFCERALDKH